MAPLCKDGKLALASSWMDSLSSIEREDGGNSITKDNGLLHNNILSVFSSSEGNLWLGLDNGISAIQYASPFSFIIPDQDLESTGYAVSAYSDKMYFGQSDGLYSLPWKNYFPFEIQNPFSKIQAADGQVWSTAELGKTCG